MAKKLKVYGGTFDGVNRLIVAAPTKKAAHEAINAVSHMSYHCFCAYSSDTGNEDEVAIATAKPGAVFSSNTRNGAARDYIEKPPRQNTA